MQIVMFWRQPQESMNNVVFIDTQNKLLNGNGSNHSYQQESIIDI